MWGTEVGSKFNSKNVDTVIALFTKVGAADFFDHFFDRSLFFSSNLLNVQRLGNSTNRADFYTAGLVRTPTLV